MFWTGGQSAAPCWHPKPAHNSTKDDYANAPHSLLFSQEWEKGSMWKKQLFPSHVENKPRERREGMWTEDSNTSPCRAGRCLQWSYRSGQQGSEPQLRAQEMNSSDYWTFSLCSATGQSSWGMAAPLQLEGTTAEGALDERQLWGRWAGHHLVVAEVFPIPHLGHRISKVQIWNLRQWICSTSVLQWLLILKYFTEIHWYRDVQFIL